MERCGPVHDSRRPTRHAEPLHRRALRLALVGFTILTSCNFIFGQSGSESSTTQDPNAIAALTIAINSMGGTTAFTTIQDATVTCQTSAGQITWQSIGMSIRYTSTSRSGNSIYTDQSGTGYVEDSSGNVSPMDPRLALTLFPFDIPGAVLNYLLNASNETLSVVQDAGANPSIVHVRSLIQMSDPSLTPVTQQDWYIDMSTGLPSRVDYYLPNAANPALDGTATILFTSWQKTPTVLIPQTYQLLNNSAAVNTVTLGTPVFNQGPPATIFQLP